MSNYPAAPGSQSGAEGPNSHNTMHDIFVLTDEQILEIDPDPQDIEVSQEPRSRQVPRL